jgi:glucokinase
LITIGLDVGGTKVLGVALHTGDPTTLLAEERVLTPEGGEGLLQALVDLAARLTKEVAALGVVEAMGVGVPGLVDRHGTLHLGPHLRHIADLPLSRAMTDAVGVPVLVDNDANCHGLAEQRAGAAKGAADALIVTLGTGIGGGLITRGHLLRGSNGFAGEPGHMIVDPNGPPCPCGQRGCWERFASGSGLARLARDAAAGGRLDAAVALADGHEERVQGEHVTAAARAGDAEALAVLDEFAWWIGLGLANLTNILDPTTIVIGGGLVEAADLLLPRVERAFAELVMAGEERRLPPVVAAHLGERAGAIGAALLPTEA